MLLRHGSEVTSVVYDPAGQTTQIDDIHGLARGGSPFVSRTGRRHPGTSRARKLLDLVAAAEVQQVKMACLRCASRPREVVITGGPEWFAEASYRS